MSDKTPEKKSASTKNIKDVGEGDRSLSNWQRLAAVRQGGAGQDVRGLLADYGIKSAGVAAADRPSVAALERRLKFAGEVEREALGVHRVASLVVGPVAVAVAGVAAGVGAAVCAAAVAGNAAYACNAVQTGNVAWTVNWVSGDSLV